MATRAMVALTSSPVARGGGRAVPALADGGLPIALWLGAGFALRALSHALPAQEAVVRRSLDRTAVLAYCVAFGCALCALASSRYPPVLHVGAALMTGAALYAGVVGATPATSGATAAGALLMVLAMGYGAFGARTGFTRVATAWAALGPLLFGLHLVAFPEGGSLLSARFLRLAAAAATALPLLATLYWVRHPGDATRATRLVKSLLAVGMVALPLTLVGAALVDARVAYALGPASDCFTVALIIACFQAWRSHDNATLVGFAVVLAGMLLGKAMGFYAFEGPMPAPAPLAGYNDEWRVALRNVHIDLVVAGFVLLLWPSLARLPIVAVVAATLGISLLATALPAYSWIAGIAVLGLTLTFWRNRATP